MGLSLHGDQVLSLPLGDSASVLYKTTPSVRLLGREMGTFPSCKEITSGLSVCQGHQPRKALRKIGAVVLLCSRWFLNHLQHLKQQQEGLSHLISIIKDDLEDIKLIEHGLNESIPIRGGVFS